MLNLMKEYSLHSKVYRVYNKRTMTTEESIHIAFDETNHLGPRKDIIDDVVEAMESSHINDKENESKKEKESENETLQ